MTAVSSAGRGGKGTMGERRRTQIVRAAAALALEEGPAAVTHRAVAERAGVSLSATTYYFAGLEELLAEAGAVIVAVWAITVERVGRHRAETVRRGDVEVLIEALLEALLPPRVRQLQGQYEHLVGAGRTPAVARVYAEGRIRIDAAVASMLDAAGNSSSPSLVVAIIDGAAVAALSEGRPVRDTARELLRQVL